MNYKFIAFSIITAGIFSVSCRQADETLMEEEFQSSAQKIQNEESSTMSRDSVYVNPVIGNGPPKDGTHWKSKENDEELPLTIIKKGDSILTSVIIDEGGPKMPPKDGTHWRAK